MLAVQALAAWAMFIAAWCMGRNWTEVIGGNVPRLTDLALHYPVVIPAGAAILAVIVVFVALRRGRPATEWFLALAVAEIIALALFAVAISMPALAITYRLGP